MHEEKPLTKEAIDELLEQPKGNTVIMADGCLHEFLYAFVKDVEAHRLFEFGRMGCGLSGAEEKAQKAENS